MTPLRFWVAALVLLAVAAPAGIVEGQSSPNASIFQVIAWREIGRQFESEAGTGFFIDSDGTALTASHVVYRARSSRTFHIAAIVGKEVYNATLICASELPGDPTKSDRTELSRDVAEIRLTANSADSPGDLTYRGVPYATAHHGPLPAFPFLRLAPPTDEGETVRTFGFGRMRTAPMPYPWSATGTIERKLTFRDGTPGLRIRYSTPTEPGHSGSPVLNALGKVIGMHNWHSESDPHLGTAISSAALDPACP